MDPRDVEGRLPKSLVGMPALLTVTPARDRERSTIATDPPK